MERSVTEPGTAPEQRSGQRSATRRSGGLSSGSVKLLYVGPVPPIEGGIAQHGARLIEALRARGHEVTVVTWGTQYPRLLYPGEQPRRGAFSSEVEPILSWYNPLSWIRVMRRARSFDRVILQWVHPIQALPVAAIVRGSATPTVAIVHNAQPHEPFPLASSFTRLALRKASFLVTHAVHQAERLGEILRRVDVDVAPHPPNFTIEPVEPPPTPPWRLLFAGYIRAYKGPDVAIEALGLLRERGIEAELTMLGSFWDPEAKYRTLIERLGLADRVTIVNQYAPEEVLAAAIQSHHILVAPYRAGTQSGLIPLALSAGRPVTATSVGGLAAQVPAGGGHTAPPGDPAAFATAVAATIDDYATAQRVAREAAPTWDTVAAAVTGGPQP